MLGCLSTLYTHTCMLKCDWQCLDFNCIARSAIVRCFSHIFWLYSGLHYSAKYEISFSSKTLSSKSAPAVMHLGLYYVHVYKYRSSLCIGCFKLRPEMGSLPTSCDVCILLTLQNIIRDWRFFVCMIICTTMSYINSSAKYYHSKH